MADPRPLFHVGYHKTATTWLQNVVFQPDNGFLPVLSHAEIFAHIVRPHGLRFDRDPAKTLINDRMADAKASGDVGVLSLESLTGSPFSGGRESDVFAKRLKTIWPDAKILITVREQTRIIASIYMQYLSRGGTESAAQFFGGNDIEAFYGFTAENFEFDRLVGHYQGLFGAENVLVMPFEMISGDQAAAMNLLGTFAGNRRLQSWQHRPAVAVSHSEVSAPVLRRLNNFRATPLNRAPFLNLGGFGDFLYRAAGGGTRRLLKPRRRPVSALAERLFLDRYIDSNRRLKDLLHHEVDLSGYQGIN